MDAYFPFFVCVGALVGSVFCLRVFFTLWGPIDRKLNRKLNGDKPDVAKDIQLTELNNKSVHVHLKSGIVLENMVLVGYYSAHHEASYDLKQLLILRDKQNKRYYVRIREIVYFEETEGSSSL